MTLLKGVGRDDRLLINIAPKYVYFEAYIEDVGGSFKIKKTELIKLLNGEKKWKDKMKEN